MIDLEVDNVELLRMVYNLDKKVNKVFKMLGKMFCCKVFKII